MHNIAAKIIKEIKENKRIDIIILFLGILTIYVHNLSPSVYGGDSGDLISASITNGVPHPSGYPLFTMLGILALKLPIAATPAWKVGLVSAFFSSLSVVIMYFLILELTKNRYLSFVTALILAFLYPFWLYAEIAEVFALNNFFILVLVLITARYLNSKKAKYIYYLAFLTGLSLTNNLTIVLLFPGIALTVLLANKKILLKIKLIIKSVGLLFLGLSPYVYIPISALNNPSYSWGKAVNLKNFISVVFRKEYGWGVTTEGLNDHLRNIEQLKNYARYIISYTSILLPVAAFLGIIYLFRKKRFQLLMLIVFSYLFVGPFYWFYSRFPLSSLTIISTYEKFYLASIVIMVALVPLGILFLQSLINKAILRKSLSNLATKAVFATFLVLPISSFLVNFPRLNFSDVYIGDNFGIDILNSLPKDSVAMLTGDTKVFNSFYVQNAYAFRNDVYIPGRPDSFIGLLRYTNGSEGEIDSYIISRGGTIDRKTFAEMLPNLMLEREAFTDHSLQNMQLIHQGYGKLVFVPWGLVKKLYFENQFEVTKEEYVSEMKLITSSYQIEGFNKRSSLLDYSVNYADIQMFYAQSYYSIADFIATHYKDPDAALYFLEKSIALDPLAD